MVLGLALSGFSLLGWFDASDSMSFDAHLRRRAARPPPPGLVVIGVTDACIARLGAWPWPRATHARLLRVLKRSGARVVVWDLGFIEPSALGPGDDAELARAIRDAGNVLLPVTLAGGAGESVRAALVPGSMVEAVPQLVSSLPALGRAAAGSGHVFLTQDPDGPVRSYCTALPGVHPPVVAMPLAATRLARGVPVAHPRASPVRIAIDYLGPPGATFPVIPYASVLRGELEPGKLDGRVIVVGSVVPRLHDTHLTPVGPMFGTEVLATATANQLEGRVPRRLPDPASTVLVVLAALLAVLMLDSLGSSMTAAVMVLLPGICWISTACQDAGVFIPVTGILLSVAGAYLSRLYLVAREWRAHEEREARERARIEAELVAIETAVSRGDLVLAGERLATLREVPEGLEPHRRATSLSLLLATGQEMELEDFLDHEPLETLPGALLEQAAITLEERRRPDLAELLLRVRARALRGKAAGDAIEIALERLVEAKSRLGLRSPVVKLARRALGNGYRDVALLGIGGMGFVVKAWHITSAQGVAVKFLSPSFTTHAEVRKRFEREVRMLMSLDHPAIVRVLAASLELHPHYVMELFDGQTLAELLAREHRLPLDRAGALLAPVARALSHAHAAGLVHRDVKPTNILIDRDGRVKLADFGIAKSFEMSALTPTGEMLGTPDYMAPEQLTGERGGLDHRADVYALGVVLYQALTGRLPVASDTPLALRLTAEPIPVSKAGVNLPPDVEAIVMQSISPRAADRPDDAVRLAEVLDGHAGRS